MTDRFPHSHMKIQARLHTIDSLTNHPLKRIFVPVMKQDLPKTYSSFGCGAGTVPHGQLPADTPWR